MSKTRYEMLRRVWGIAWPITIGGFVALGLQSGQIWILGHGFDNKPLYLLSVLQPYYFLFIAFLDAFAVTNQVFSARAKAPSSGKDVMKSTLTLSVAGVSVTLLLAAASVAVVHMLGATLTSESLSAARTLPSYMASLAPFMMFEMCLAGLRGQGRSLGGLIWQGLLAILNLAITYYFFFSKEWGFKAVVLANSVAPLVLIPFVFLTLRRFLGHDDSHLHTHIRAQLTSLLVTVGVPMFFTMLAVFASSVVIFPVLASRAGAYAAAFLIVLKLRTIFIVPAVGVGTAIAIVINQGLERTKTEQQSGLLARGMGAIAIGYLVLTLLILCFRRGAVNLMAGETSVRAAGHQLMIVLLPTFLLIPLVAAMQTILEQLGRGKRVLLFTLAIEILTAGTVSIGNRIYSKVGFVPYVLVGSSVLYLLVFCNELRLLHRQMRAP
jgi:Na+-driven multidrug efflux pump